MENTTLSKEEKEEKRKVTMDVVNIRVSQPGLEIPMLSRKYFSARDDFPSFETGHTFFFKVTKVFTPNFFYLEYVNVNKPNPAIIKTNEEIKKEDDDEQDFQRFYNNKQWRDHYKLKIEVIPLRVYAFKWDNKWERARVITIEPEIRRAEILLVDLELVCWSKWEDLYEMCPTFMRASASAIYAGLFGAKPKAIVSANADTQNPPTWTKNVIDEFKKMVLGKKMLTNIAKGRFISGVNFQQFPGRERQLSLEVVFLEYNEKENEFKILLDKLFEMGLVAERTYHYPVLPALDNVFEYDGFF